MSKSDQICGNCVMGEFINLPYSGHCIWKKLGVMPVDGCDIGWQPASLGFASALANYHAQVRILIVSAQNDQAWDETWLVKLLELSRICKRKLAPKRYGKKKESS